MGLRGVKNDVARDRDMWRALKNAVMKFRIP